MPFGLAKWLVPLTVVAVIIGWVIALDAGVGVVGWGFPGAIGLWALGYGGVGALIIRSRDRHPIGTLLVLVGVTAGSVDAAIHLSLALEWHGILATVGSAAWMVPTALIVNVVARFPDGDWAFRRARLLTALMWVVVAAGIVVAPFAPVRAEGSVGVGISNPWEAGWWAEVPGWLPHLPYFAYQLMTLLIVVMSIVALFRADPTRRRQIGVVVFTVGVVALSAAFAAYFDSTFGSTFATILAIGVALVALSMLVAVTRYRLYDLDRLVSRAISYLVTIAVLAGSYLAFVVALRDLLPVSGDVPVAVSTLAVALMFLPVVRRVQRAVDHRFFRARYDSEQVVSQVAIDLQGKLDIADVAETAMGAVEKALSPTALGVWLMGEES